jgi:hypothetical protein
MIKHLLNEITDEIGLKRLITSPLRLKPNFIIIGAQRCGTTSLYNYLTRHPSILPARVKEVHYFDYKSYRGLLWYKANFPMLTHKLKRYIKQKTIITGEASPFYLYHPHAFKRIAQVLPNIKLIVILRNPVDRALSHYIHEVNNLKKEWLSFDKAIQMEEIRIREERKEILEE